MSLDTTSLPSELLTAPQPLIGICGLDIGRNTVHKNVWDAFSNNRKSDRPAAAYKLLPANYEFPVAKPKRNSYEWYHPKGILKRNWMLKHLHVLPSVVVVFQELEWNDPQWTEISLYCASTIQALKNALQERNTRICLVLLQKSAPLPPGEDLLATERATSLTVTCGLNTKMLFILPHNEHIMGYVLRLESAFLDLAQTYYALMSKRIRTHRDQLTTAHTTLKLRHQFKLGFVAEIRQDFNTALKHYTQAYSNLDEIRITDVNCLEIKTIAGFLNYKICRLMFKLKVPRDAINNFISHIEKYKNRSGFKEIIFEHYAWLSTQHSVFAELFCEAVKNGLPALQTQHPGMYYYKAAEYIVKRRESFQQSNALLLSPIETSAPTTLQANSSMGLFTEYFGIRAVKAGEPLSEQQVNMFVCEQEKNFNHSSAIITLLGQAMAQFKIYKGLRFRKKLAIDMAEEYFKSGDHAKALTLYSLMLPDYREDKWSVIFSDVLFKTLRCALLSASVGDYISCSIEALSLKNRSERKERIVVLENLWKVFACVPPVPHGQIAPELRDLWQNAWSSAKTPVPIDLDKVAEVVDLSASFEKVELQNDEMINVLLLVKVLTDVPLKMQRFSLIISDGTRSFKLMPSKYAYCSTLSELRDPAFIASMEYQAIETDLVLEPHYYYQLLFATEAKQFFENTQLYVTRIEALMGSDKLTALLFKNAALKRKQFREHSRIKHLDDTMPINSMCYIVPTFHLSAQTQLAHPRMLVNEYFPVTTLISNPHDVFLLNVGLSVSVPNELRNKVFLTTDIASGRQKLHSQLQIDIGEMSMHATNTAVFYVFSLIETSITLQQRLYYNLDIEKPRSLTTTTTTTAATSGTAAAAAGGTTTQATQITENIALSNSTDVSPEHIRAPPPPPPTAAALQNGGVSDTAKSSSAYTSPPIQVEFLDETTLRKTREEVLTLECDLEFKFSGRYYTLNKKPLQRAYRGENFLLRVNMEVMSTHTELDILDTYFICDHNLVQSNYSFKRKKFSHTYRQGDKLEDVVVLRSNATLSDWLTAKEFERSKSDTKTLPQWRLHTAHSKVPNPSQSQQPESDATNSSDLQKSLLGKIANNMTIVNGNTTTPAPAAIPPAMSLLFAANQTGTPTMSNSLTSEDGNLEVAAKQQQQPAYPVPLTNSTRCIFNRAMEAIQPTGHHRGFIRGIVTTDKQQAISPASGQLQQNPPPHFGIYCIKWRRHGGRDEIESKFLINGLDIAEPLLNVYCSIEERMFVKMPMTFKVTLKNPTSKVLHLIATLSISNIDNFICSGHKQLDVSIFAFGEKELVYNLYPLYVGWQNLPELTLEFNTQVDPSKDDKQNKLLNELVERSMPKKVFVLPPLKQQTK